VGLVELRRQVLDRHVTFRKAELPELRSRVRPSGLFLGIAGATGLVGLVLYLGPPPEAVRPLVFVFAIGVWVLSVCMHEFGHAAAAYAGGDPSVEDAGYLTFDPRKYTHPVLSVIMPVLFLVMGGLPLPGGAVYVDRMALRSSRWDSFVSLAGPLGTLAVALVLAVPFWLGWPSGAHVVFWGAIALAASLQVMALLLNLLPLPPLDGFGVIAPLFMTWEARTRAYQASGLVLMVVFVAFWLGLPIFDPLWRLSFGALELLGIGREWVALGWRMFRLPVRCMCTCPSARPCAPTATSTRCSATRAWSRATWRASRTRPAKWRRAFRAVSIPCTSGAGRLHT
jgi:Zn-dependent protease